MKLINDINLPGVGQLEDNAPADQLSKIAASDKSARVRGTAAWAIGPLRGDGGRAPAGLVALLKDTEDDARLFRQKRMRT